MQNKTLAAIDIGTNTFRLLIARIEFNSETNDYSFREIYSERIITRLGTGLHEKGKLRQEAIDRSIAALNKFKDVIDRSDVYKTSAVATSALRVAVNSNDFLNAARESTGLCISVISGEEEARITASGMMIDIPVPKTSLLIDIGGGSTELIFAERKVPAMVQSVDLGVVHLADKFMSTDPLSDNNLKLMDNEVSLKSTRASSRFSGLVTEDTTFIGTAGTVTALAAISQNLTQFEHDKIHKFRLPFKSVRELYSTLSSLSSKERAEYIPFELARLDIIVPGTLILLKLMEYFGFNEITVSNYGLREGILIDLYNRENTRKE